ncbi:BC1872 family protein [Paenibacillus chitinolyticus]
MTEQQIIETLAMKVMGWTKDRAEDFAGHEWVIKEIWREKNGQLAADGDWNPLQNIADAWMIVEKMGQGNDEVHYRFVKYFMGWSIHDITPEEICKAAIEAVA